MGASQSIIVTGAAGFIGSGVVRYLNDQGQRHLLLVDDFLEGCKERNLVGKQYRELISKHALLQWLQDHPGEIEAIIHLGACSDTLETNRDYLMENNYLYTVRLAEYALKNNIRFIYASSAATYGDGREGFSDDHHLLESLRPLNLYGLSKHLFDLWAKKQGVLDRLVGLKYFNVFGPNEGHKGRMASMVCKLFPDALREGVIRLYKSSEPSRFADGEQCRDFIYVKDAVVMTCSFLENKVGGIFNIGRGSATTWNTLAKALFQALDKPGQIEYIVMPDDLIAQYQNYTCAAMDKYQKTMSYAFQYTIEEAVSDYALYLLKDQRW